LIPKQLDGRCWTDSERIEQDRNEVSDLKFDGFLAKTLFVILKASQIPLRKVSERLTEEGEIFG
jgi:hypothetical protein